MFSVKQKILDIELRMSMYNPVFMYTFFMVVYSYLRKFNNCSNIIKSFTGVSTVDNDLGGSRLKTNIFHARQQKMLLLL